MDTRTGHLVDGDPDARRKLSRELEQLLEDPADPLDRFHDQLAETVGDLQDVAEQQLKGGEADQVDELRQDLEAKLEGARAELAGLDPDKLRAALAKLTSRPATLRTRRQRARIRVLRRALAGRGYDPVPAKLEAEARRELDGQPDTFVKPGGQLDRWAGKTRQQRQELARRAGQR